MEFLCVWISSLDTFIQESLFWYCRDLPRSLFSKKKSVSNIKWPLLAAQWHLLSSLSPISSSNLLSPKSTGLHGSGTTAHTVTKPDLYAKKILGSGTHVENIPQNLSLQVMLLPSVSTMLKATYETAANSAWVMVQYNTCHQPTLDTVLIVWKCFFVLYFLAQVFLSPCSNQDSSSWMRITIRLT